VGRGTLLTGGKILTHIVKHTLTEVSAGDIVSKQVTESAKKFN